MSHYESISLGLWKSISRRVRSIALAMLLLPLTSLAVQAADARVTYYYTDPQGTVLATADAAGNLISPTDHRPYGVQALGTPQAAPGYTGHVNDPDSGFIYMQARYYDPGIGRFVSSDPMMSQAGNAFNFNRYAYANNNPVVNVDRNGGQTVPGSIDWQAPGMMEGWKASGREVVIPAMLDTVVPGGGLVNCAMQGCGPGGWAMAAIPMVGEVRGAARVAKTAERMAQVAEKGRRGEEAVRATANIGDKLSITTAAGKTRVPDGLIPGVSLSEVKNVSSQSLTSQLRDYSQFAKDNKLEFNLYTNEESKLSRPLQDAIDSGDIKHTELPMN